MSYLELFFKPAILFLFDKLTVLDTALNIEKWLFTFNWENCLSFVYFMSMGYHEYLFSFDCLHFRKGISEHLVWMMSFLSCLKRVKLILVIFCLYLTCLIYLIQHQRNYYSTVRYLYSHLAWNWLCLHPVYP